MILPKFVSKMYKPICNINTLTLVVITLREESSQTNVILQYKLLATIFSAVCSVIQKS